MHTKETDMQRDVASTVAVPQFITWLLLSTMKAHMQGMHTATYLVTGF